MFDNNLVLIVVPARGGSKGIELKNLVEVGGQPLIALSGNVIKELDFVDRAIVSTDHPSIAKVAENSGLDVPFLRPKHLSGDRISDVDVLTHALLSVEKQDQCQFDIILMLQPTSPFRRAVHVYQTIEKLVRGSFDSVLTVSETDSKNHPLKQLILHDNKISFFDDKGATIIARQQLTPMYHRNGVAYAMTRECLVSQKTTIGKNASAVVIEEPMVNIDTEYDLALAQFLSKKQES